MSEGSRVPGWPGHCPRATTEQIVLRKCFARGNHASFYDAHGEEVHPGVQLMRDAIASGVAEAFPSREVAEAALGPTHPSPLGNLRKPKGDGWKDRVIHDYKASLVNLMVAFLMITSTSSRSTFSS